MRASIGLLFLAAEPSFGSFYARGYDAAMRFRCAGCYHLFGVDLIQERLSKFAPGVGGEALFTLYMMNPFAVLITGYREAMMYGQFIPSHWWLILTAESLLLFWIGYRIYQFYDRRVIKFL